MPILAPNGREKHAERVLKLLSRLKERDATMGDENWRGGLPFRSNNANLYELPWCVGEGANGDFLVHIISREGMEVGQIAPVHRRLLRDDLLPRASCTMRCMALRAGLLLRASARTLFLQFFWKAVEIALIRHH